MIANRFFGPWLVVATDIDPWPAQSIVVVGSTNADGRHLIEYGQAFELAVDGPEWSLTIQFLSSGGAWLPSEARPSVPEGGARATHRFDGVNGLVVRLGTGSGAWETLVGDIWYTGVVLECVSRDEDLNPLVGPNPYDFTYPALSEG